MKTEWINEADQGELDRAHDECSNTIERLSAEFKLAAAQAARKRDRTEARVFDKIATSLGVPVSGLQPVRDSQGIPLAVTFAETASPGQNGKFAAPASKPLGLALRTEASSPV